MPTLMAEGIAYQKRDGQCAFPSCERYIDFQLHPKPTPGWGHVILSRTTRKGIQRREMILCPEHTINFTTRQVGLKAKVKSFVRTIIESPFAGDVATNLKYLRAAMSHCLHMGEAPYASHPIYTQEGVLDDTVPEERKLGIDAGLSWGEAAQKVAVYTDLGITPGMHIGIQRHKENGKIVEMRSLGEWSSKNNLKHE